MTLEVDRLKTAIRTALTEYESQITSAVDAALDSIDVAQMVRAAVEENLPGILQQEIQNALRDGVREVMWDSNVQATFRKKTAEGVVKILNRMTEE